MTKAQLFSFEGSADDMSEGSDDYFAIRAIESYGMAVRDNSINELISIGRNIETCQLCANGAACFKHD